MAAVAPGPAVVNAINFALEGRFSDYPVTPEKIIAFLEKRGNGRWDKGGYHDLRETLTLEELERIAVYGENVEVVEEAWERVRAARKLIFDLDKRGVAVYGLNRGVGWNKDKKVFASFYDRYVEIFTGAI